MTQQGTPPCVLQGAASLARRRVSTRSASRLAGRRPNQVPDAPARNAALRMKAVTSVSSRAVLATASLASSAYSAGISALLELLTVLPFLCNQALSNETSN